VVNIKAYDNRVINKPEKRLKEKRNSFAKLLVCLVFIAVVLLLI